MKPIKNVIWPKDEIVLSKKHIFNHAEYQTVGNTMEYIDNAIPFYRLKEYNEDEQVYINMCINISKTLKEVHEAGRPCRCADVLLCGCSKRTGSKD